jgi:hypothetical protein
LPLAASAQPVPSQAEWINALRRGGHVVVFRHGATTDQTNIDSMSRKSVSGERQLNEQGRAQAKSIGEWMQKLNIPAGQVLTSTTERAVDTGKLLGFGDVTTHSISPRAALRFLRTRIAGAPRRFANSLPGARRPAPTS